jgi:cytoskeletal protein RodZ
MTDSVGARLRQARELRRLSLQEVSEATKVRTHYLQALENDDHSAIPSAAQARGFLRIYAEFLELDLGELLAALPREASPAAPPVPVTEPTLVASPGLWASLRQRLTRSSGRQPAGTESVPAPTTVMPVESSMPEQPTDITASTDVKTQVAGRTRADSEDVKKNSMS